MPTSSGFQINEVLTASNTNTYLLRSSRNAIINGAMNIAQRSSSVAGITGFGYYTADRWAFSLSAGAGTWTQTVQSIAATDSPMSEGVRNSIKMTCTIASASPAAGVYGIFAQAIEGQNLQQFSKGNSTAKNFAVSFWVRSNVIGTYIVELYENFSPRSVSASYTISASNTWQKVRLIFPADAIGAFTNSNTSALGVHFWLIAGTDYTAGTLQTSWATPVNNKRASGQTNLASAINNFIEFTAIQLEPNSVCTPFEVEDIEVTRAKCWRYFQRHFQPAMRGVVSNAGVFNRMMLGYPPMRATPSATTNGGTMGYYDGTSAVNAGVSVSGFYQFSANTTLEADINSAGWGANRPAVFYQFNGATFYIDLSAEL